MAINVRKLEQLTRQLRSLVAGHRTAEEREASLLKANVLLNELLGMIVESKKKGGRR